ncbi:SS18-like protein 2 [Cyprinus carpio]|uniref:SS18-like protein 2 n=1 Tax=Cyprinus carpio TaxID=7962 RepID=A0A9R0BEK3_CYPCA|nr:SS18-like protein 2 [Cyprinus carpio]
MSVVFVPKRQRGKEQINQETIQRPHVSGTQRKRNGRVMLVPSLSAVCRGNLQRRRYRAERPLEVLDPRCWMRNDQLVRCITEYLQKAAPRECVQYQQILHRNIVYLGTIADASTEILPETQTSDHTNRIG